jgi:hypothetical protein
MAMKVLYAIVKILVFILSVIGNLQQAYAQTVNTEASASGGVTYYHEEDSPSKINWKKWAFCPGRNSKSETKDYTGDVMRSNNNSGEIITKGPDDGPLALLTSKLNWSAVFDESELIFRVLIKKEIGQNRTTATRTACFTHSWDYKVNAVTSEVNTAVKLLVPNNVWVMRIKSDSNLVKQHIQILRGRRMPDQHKGQSVVSDALAIASNGYSYYFTKPGEEFEIKVNFKDSNLRASELIASIEVNFIGENRCKKTVSELLGHSYSWSDGKIASQVQKSLSLIEQGLVGARSSSNNGDQFDKSTVFIGCMMNEDVANRVMFHNDIDEIKNLLNTIQQYREKATELQLKTPGHQSSGDAMKLVTQMALVSLSSNILEGIKPYCAKSPIFDIKSGKQIGYEHGYVVLARKLRSAQAALGLEKGAPGFSAFYTKLLETYMSFVNTGRSYADLASKPTSRMRLAQFAELFEADNKVLLLDQALMQLSALGRLKPNADLVGMANELVNVEQLTTSIHHKFVMELERYIKGDQGVPSVNGWSEEIESLRIHSEKLRHHLDRLLELIDLDAGGFVAGKFREATTEILTEFLYGPADWLKDSYGGYFKEFLATLKPAISVGDQNAKQKKEVINKQSLDDEFFFKAGFKEVTSCLAKSASRNK